MAENFTRPQPNLIESDAGFSIEVLGRTGLRYREREKEALIDSEALGVPGAMVMYRNSVRTWEPPHADEPMGEADKDRIVTNIARAFAALGFDLNVV